jgi:hypothetical protein
LGNKEETRVGFREKLNDNPVATGSVVAACVAIALLMLLRPACSSPGSAGANRGVSQAFFTVDDGQTWFAADARKLPPFDQHGKPAYRAQVYRCRDGPPFVGYLERYAEADRKRLEQLLAGEGAHSAEAMKLLMQVEVKKPGARDWVRQTPATMQRFNAVRMPRCPDGSTTGITRVAPE